MGITRFIEQLEELPSGKGVFNPWREVDAENDLGRDCPGIRRGQLAHFLKSRLGRARFLIIGEASGYQGCHFTGIPMTSERILLGNKRDIGITPESILPGLPPRRTSRPELNPGGFSEPTATIVWGTVASSSIDPRAVCIWNTVPQHLYNPAKGLLSNRNPSQQEIVEGIKILEGFLGLFPRAELIAVGNAAATGLTRMGRNFTKVRHPARGGSTLFRAQAARIFNPKRLAA